MLVTISSTVANVAFAAKAPQSVLFPSFASSHAIAYSCSSFTSATVTLSFPHFAPTCVLSFHVFSCPDGLNAVLSAGCPNKKASAFMGALIKSAPHPKDESDLLQKPNTKEGSEHRPSKKDSCLKEDDGLYNVECEFIHDQEPKQPGNPDHEYIELGSADEGKMATTIKKMATTRPVLVEDVIKIAKKKTGRKSSGSNKALLSKFNNKELALLAKQCVQKVTCIINMYPDNVHFAFPTFSEEIKCLLAEGQGGEYLADLNEIAQDAVTRDEFVDFLVSNGTMQLDPAAGNDEDDVPESEGQDGDGQDLAAASQ
ncbi:hypothetical protein GYMLUDRAFT_251359 [Collybiopsis luxurians FD-317 M1]|uniref:Uncharacterized protein n=1 Tax=Collybiopsis luxurians FD-317 M1 TaxID=944289 RepID=A0A0D0C3C0_9AGAR|nr:hypothetical protein GYMLUDRAFT_251359 [Collybiopsis luxurians FD-317 M1]